MPAPAKTKRPLSLRELAGIYGLSASALHKWEKKGADPMSPISLHCAMRRSDRGLNSGAAFWRVFSSKDAVLAHCVAIVGAVRAKGLKASDYLDYVDW